MCHHIHAHFVLERCGERRRVFGCYRVWAANPNGNFGYSVVDTVVMASCQRCGAILSIGPSNDDIPLSEIVVASCAHSDADLDRYDNEGAFAWDVTRPLREQWPWCGGLTTEETATIIEQSSDSYMPFETKHAELIGLVKELPVSPVEPREGWQGEVLDQIESPANIDSQIEAIGNRFAPVDTASREPWHTTQETQSTGNSETIDALIERSSVGQGLRNIRENGIDAELKQLEEEMKLLPDAHGGADL